MPYRRLSIILLTLAVCAGGSAAFAQGARKSEAALCVSSSGTNPSRPPAQASRRRRRQPGIADVPAAGAECCRRQGQGGDCSYCRPRHPARLWRHVGDAGIRLMNRWDFRRHVTRTTVAAAVALACAGLCATRADAGVRRVWAVNDGVKVDRDARDHPARNANSAWDGRRVRVFAARNEVLAFQLIVEANDTGIKRLAVSLPRLNGPDGNALVYKAPALDPTDYVDRPIQLFVAHYMHVAMPSHASWVYARGSAAAPPTPPDGSRCSWCRRTRRRAACRSKWEPIETQAIWFEIYTGPGQSSRRVHGRDRDRCRRRPSDAADRTRALRLRSPGPQQHARHAVLRELAARALSRTQSRSGVSPAGASPSCRTGARLRRELTVACAGPFHGRGLHASARLRRPWRRRGNVIAPRTFYGPGPFRGQGHGVARERRAG